MSDLSKLSVDKLFNHIFNLMVEYEDFNHQARLKAQNELAEIKREIKRRCTHE